MAVRAAPILEGDAALLAYYGGWSEADLDAFVRRTALSLGFMAYHTHTSLYSESGFPDWVLAKPSPEGRGRLILAELKREGKLPTPGHWGRGRRRRWLTGQTDWLRALSRCAGVEAYWWVPSDVSDITEILTNGPRDDMACVRRLAALLAREGAGGKGDAGDG